MSLLLLLLVNALAILLSAYLVPGVVVNGFITALIVSVVLGLINIFVKPFIILLTLPITIVTLGLFIFVINTLMVMIADYFVPGFSVSSFWTALIFSVILSIVNLLFTPLKA